MVDVTPTSGMPQSLPVTTAVAERTDGDLPACRLRRVTAYIDENLRRELRLAELSAVVHMSPYHFARLFKRSTGVSPHRFVVRRRIDEARALLATQTVAIAEIAWSVGFRTPSHFTTTFRRITGMTPTEYRRAEPPLVLESGQPLLEGSQAAGVSESEPTQVEDSSSWQLRHVPAAAERLHQQHAGVHAATEDVDLVALVREGHGLRGDDLEIVVDSAPVAVGEELERLLGRLHCPPLLLRLLLEDAESGQVVLDLLEGGERGLTVAGHGRIVGGEHGVGRGAAAPAVENRLCDRCPHRPQEARCVQDVPERASLESDRGVQHQRRIVRGLGDADLLVGLGDPALGGCDVRAPLQQLGR